VDFPPIKDSPINEVGFFKRTWVAFFTGLKDSISASQEAIDLNTITTIRITNADSPYTTLNANYNILCDTDGGAMTVNYLVGLQGRSLRVSNVGISGNNVSLVSTQGIRGELTQTLFDEDVLNTFFDDTEFWV